MAEKDFPPKPNRERLVANTIAEMERRGEEIARLQQWVHDLQSGMYINCVYCGHRYGPKDKVPATMADALKRHVAECSKHPMAELLRCAKSALDRIKPLIGDPDIRSGYVDVACDELEHGIAIAEGRQPAP